MRHCRNRKPVVALQIGIGSANGSEQSRCSTEVCTTATTNNATQHIASTACLQTKFRCDATTDYATTEFVFIKLAVLGAQDYLRKATLAAIGTMFALANLLAILHWLPLTICIFPMPVVLHSAEDKLHILFKFDFELFAVVVHFLQKSFVVRRPP